MPKVCDGLPLIFFAPVVKALFFVGVVVLAWLEAVVAGVASEWEKAVRFYNSESKIVIRNVFISSSCLRRR